MARKNEDRDETVCGSDAGVNHRYSGGVSFCLRFRRQLRAQVSIRCYPRKTNMWLTGISQPCTCSDSIYLLLFVDIFFL